MEPGVSFANYRFDVETGRLWSGDVSDSPAPTHDISAIAVLPFADMSPGRDQDYLCEGLAAAASDRRGGLRVRPARSSDVADGVRGLAEAFSRLDPFRV